MSKKIRVLGIHGLGDHRLSDWKQEWTRAVRDCVGQDAECEFFEYDDIFEKVDLSPLEILGALFKLGASALMPTGAARAFDARGVASDRLKWTAGYVVAWVEDAGFRKQVNARLLKTIATYQPDVILAHSLGSLISYDAIASVASAPASPVAKALARTHYVTLGSQLANPFVSGNLYNGRIERLPVARWTHLFNPHDQVFTREIRLHDVDNFRQLTTPFDEPGSIANHGAVGYITHDNTRSGLWLPLAASAKVAGAPRAFATAVTTKKLPKRAPRARALLVGINEYQDPANRLSGCVNDCFLMSSVLQERGFPAEQIRLCLDARATARGIRERLEWLLDDVIAGDTLFFFCSSHGAQLPAYAEDETTDHVDETLVPYDFDWSDATSIKDNEIYQLYSQLPYGAHLMLMFDCCHSGGIHRHGAMRARGIAPPDDIRHRGLKWDPGRQMWISRDLKPLNKSFSPSVGTNANYFGESGVVARLGRASLLRKASETEYNKIKRTGNLGPYLPVILEACQENQYAYEYTHGAESYGAFTFSAAQILRASKKDPTFVDLMSGVTKRLRDLGYEQKPNLLGPKAWVNGKVPRLKK